MGANNQNGQNEANPGKKSEHDNSSCENELLTAFGLALYCTQPDDSPDKLLADRMPCSKENRRIAGYRILLPGGMKSRPESNFLDRKLPRSQVLIGTPAE